MPKCQLLKLLLCVCVCVQKEWIAESYKSVSVGYTLSRSEPQETRLKCAFASADERSHWHARLCVSQTSFRTWEDEIWSTALCECKWWDGRKSWNSGVLKTFPHPVGKETLQFFLKQRKLESLLWDSYMPVNMSVEAPGWALSDVRQLLHPLKLKAEMLMRPLGYASTSTRVCSF